MSAAVSFKEGQEVYWLHGDDHRVAKVLKVEEDRVLLSGLTTDYWMKKSLLAKKIERPYPENWAGF